jgi:predicted metal-dependent HD superfamily phosphohydrolase
MTEAPTSAEERAWLRLADHFLDTETRQDLPRAAFACVEAGFGAAAMEDALYGRVAPEVGANLLCVAGEWAGWDEAALLAAMRRRTRRPSSWKKARSRALLPGIRGTSESIARFMRLLEATPLDERATAIAALSYLGQLYFDFAPGDPAQRAEGTLARLDAPFIEAFLDAIHPATFRDDRTRGERQLARLRAQLENRRASGVDLRPLFASYAEWSSRLELPFALPERVASHLAMLYAGGARAYHDLSHVVEVLGHYRRVERWDDRAPVALAILFHDAVYDARRSDNEARSATLLANLARGTELEPLGERARALVSMTARHGSIRPGDVDDDAARFLDCDLAIVGASAARYDAYEAAVAEEYAHLPRLLYRRGRRAFLERLAARDRIFLTEAFHRAYDAAARKNLRRAIEALRR